MWIYLAIIGMSLGAGYWVGYPLLKPRKSDSPAEPSSEDSLGDVKIEKEEIYSAIKEMELDHKMGKLSQEDYLNLREKYRAKAIRSLKRMDELESKGGVSKDIVDEIEREVLAIRNDRRKVRSKRGKSLFCTQCGKKRSPEDRFCSWCGARLTNP
jgi:hypothetical protein